MSMARCSGVIERLPFRKGWSTIIGVSTLPPIVGDELYYDDEGSNT